MKTLAFYFYSLENAGGAERILTSLANELCRRGHSVHIISWDDSSTPSFYPIDIGIKWHRLGFGKGLLNKLKRTYNLFKTLRNNSIDVFIGFVMSGDKTVFSAVKAASIPLVVAERNSPTMYKLRYSKTQRMLSFTMMRLSDVITVQFPRFKTGYPKYLRGKITAIPNPVEIPESQAKPDKPSNNNRFTILAVSRLEETQKCLSCLLKAFALIKEGFPDWELRIIGDGPDKTELISLAEKLDLGKQVTFELSGTRVFDAYLESHLFVIPSLWEGFPNALAEAMAHGLPAVGFEDADGVSDLITNGQDGWLAKGLGDEKNLAEVLTEAMGAAHEREYRGELARQSMQAYKQVEQFGAWEKMLLKI